MAGLKKILDQMHQAPQGVRFSDLCKVCDHYFGPARQRGSSHIVYKTPWRGDPRVTIQNEKGMAKSTMKTKTILNNHFSYRVIWSDEDKEYVGLCAEFPSLSWLASSPEMALCGIRDIVVDVVVDMEKNSEPIPKPISSRRFSGKFMVRIPPEVHRRLAVEAAESGISLNRLASARLSR